ncbi:hypothetical protein WJX73_002594 [Symbiochloris irregularis]|uniref:Uncharacterized protein n=1 Tax=Symbiochloris irregularis TaxID=706552 RepID=A0AAW1PQI9_9CHLO
MPFGIAILATGAAVLAGRRACHWVGNRRRRAAYRGPPELAKLMQADPQGPLLNPFNNVDEVHNEEALVEHHSAFHQLQSAVALKPRDPEVIEQRARADGYMEQAQALEAELAKKQAELTQKQAELAASQEQYARQQQLVSEWEVQIGLAKGQHTSAVLALEKVQNVLRQPIADILGEELNSEIDLLVEEYYFQSRGESQQKDAELQAELERRGWAAEQYDPVQEDTASSGASEERQDDESEEQQLPEGFEDDDVIQSTASDGDSPNSPSEANAGMSDCQQEAEAPQGASASF